MLLHRLPRPRRRPAVCLACRQRPDTEYVEIDQQILGYGTPTLCADCIGLLADKLEFPSPREHGHLKAANTTLKDHNEQLRAENDDLRAQADAAVNPAVQALIARVAGVEAAPTEDDTKAKDAAKAEAKPVEDKPKAKAKKAPAKDEVADVDKHSPETDNKGQTDGSAVRDDIPGTDPWSAK